MVIRAEYKGQRYSMGSSDLLPAGFEIRFGSLNFQATWNDYLMRITNRDELHPWRLTGPGPVPCHAWCRRPGALPRGRRGPLSTMTPTKLRPVLSTGMDGTTSGCACRHATRRTRLRDGDHTREGARSS
jgi:hypothetical protein